MKLSDAFVFLKDAPEVRTAFEKSSIHTVEQYKQLMIEKGYRRDTIIQDIRMLSASSKIVRYLNGVDKIKLLPPIQRLVKILGLNFLTAFKDQIREERNRVAKLKFRRAYLLAVEQNLPAMEEIKRIYNTHPAVSRPETPTPL